MPDDLVASNKAFLLAQQWLGVSLPPTEANSSDGSLQTRPQGLGLGATASRSKASVVASTAQRSLQRRIGNVEAVKQSGDKPLAGQQGTAGEAQKDAGGSDEEEVIPQNNDNRTSVP
ncbi:hypothetical protein WJX84_006965 [Apatococcus fuscideae]|uniref:Uncharacterized protein n=1 Tax=Apatococcus fuscideae TaxID=2026836 RepID=A0AAW1SYN6_9CHLO